MRGSRRSASSAVSLLPILHLSSSTWRHNLRSNRRCCSRRAQPVVAIKCCTSANVSSLTTIPHHSKQLSTIAYHQQLLYFHSILMKAWSLQTRRHSFSWPTRILARHRASAIPIRTIAAIMPQTTTSPSTQARCIHHTSSHTRTPPLLQPSSQKTASQPRNDLEPRRTHFSCWNQHLRTRKRVRRCSNFFAPQHRRVQSAILILPF